MVDMERVVLKPPLRDIRSDLRDRLREAAANHKLHLDKAEEFKNELETLTRLLDREEARFSNQKAGGTPKEPAESLSDYVITLLQMRPMSKTELREYAERAGYPGDGRSIHATLVNLSRTGKINEISEDVYKLPEKAGSLNLTGQLNG
jgi:hypothetical protein